MALLVERMGYRQDDAYILGDRHIHSDGEESARPLQPGSLIWSTAGLAFTSNYWNSSVEIDES